MLEQDILTLYIQKPKSDAETHKGRLFPQTLELLHNAGFVFGFEGRRLDCCVRIPVGTPGSEDYSLVDYPLRIVQRPNREIAKDVAEGNADAAILGDDRFKDLDLYLRGRVRWEMGLGFGRCSYRLGLYIYSELFGHLTDKEGRPREAVLEDVEGKRIATEHPNALATLIQARKVRRAIIHEYTGGVERACYKGDRFVFIADLTTSGKTMLDNDYVPQETLFNSEAGLIVRNRLPSSKRGILDDLKARLEAARLRDTVSGNGKNGHNVTGLDMRSMPLSTCSTSSLQQEPPLIVNS